MRRRARRMASVIMCISDTEQWKEGRCLISESERTVPDNENELPGTVLS